MYGKKILKLQFQIIFKLQPLEIFYFLYILFVFSRYYICRSGGFQLIHCVMDPSLVFSLTQFYIVLRNIYYSLLAEMPSLLVTKEYVFIQVVQWLLEEKLRALQCAVFDKTLAELKTRVEKIECNKRHKTVLTELQVCTLT